MKTPTHERCVLVLKWPPRAWYYRISINFRTLMILLQIDPASEDEPEIIYEGCYETKDISIFAWFLILGVGCTIQFVDCFLTTKQIT